MLEYVAKDLGSLRTNKTNPKGAKKGVILPRGNVRKVKI